MSSQPDTNPEPQGTHLPVEWLDFVQADSARAAALGAPVDELSDEELSLRLSVLGGVAESGMQGQPLDGLRRAADQVRALESLAPKTAPGELEGLVVASMHSGARQDRAARQLEALAPQVAPRSLDEAVARLVIGDRLTGKPDSIGGQADAAAGGLFRAPGVLDRLVEESLADPAKAASKSMTSRLGRQGAPDELAARVESQLELAGREEPIGARNVVAAVVSMGLAIALVVTIGLRGNQDSTSPDADDIPGVPEEIASAIEDKGNAAESGIEAPTFGVRLEVVMLDEDSLSDDDRNMLRLLGGAL